MPQDRESASSLHSGYGRFLRQDIAPHDAFYALNEVFLQSASSEKQFLNLMDYKLSKCIEELDNQNFDSLSNLLYFKETLYRHVKRNEAVLSSFQNTEHPQWPKSNKEYARRTKEIMNQHFKHLRDQAQSLHNRCQEAISVLMNSISIAESKKAMLQAQRVGKLTFLAFIFVPLSFTASFFGMNFHELGSGQNSLWMWIALSVPVFTLTLTFYFVDLEGVWALICRSAQWFRHWL